MHSPSISPLFPYTTLFRSLPTVSSRRRYRTQRGRVPRPLDFQGTRPPRDPTMWQARSARVRSEEHTSELQSRLHLVCRLLLEKKKILEISINLVHKIT